MGDMDLLKRTHLPVFLISVFAIATPVIAERDQAAGKTSLDAVVPFFESHCVACHGTRRPKAGLNLETELATLHKRTAPGLENREFWEKVVLMLRERQMPPEAEEQPSETDRQKIISWITEELDRFDCSGPMDPGRSVMRRLNRTEYNNTVRDLLGVDMTPADNFPPDEISEGFDTIGDVLTVPPILAERYLESAKVLVDRALELDAKRETKQILVCQPSAGSDARDCARRILEPFVTRAYRRPPRAAELDRLLGFVKSELGSGQGFESAIALGLQAVLSSPNFLFRVEAAPGPESAGKVAEPLNDYELATRLSYLLWSSIPDDRLLELAGRKELQTDAVLEAEVRRMLQSPRADEFVENFFGQWLQTRKLDGISRDASLFPHFDEKLRNAMKNETLLFAKAILREDRSILELLDADFTYVNEKLARHYNMTGVEGPEFRRVATEASRGGGGILTHASILTLTSNPTRTSPVKRGNWVLEQLLGTPPPPPPPDVPELEETEQAALTGSLRQRLEQHRNNPNCSICHDRIDPLGFALENFDATGAWRDFDGKFLIDPSGSLPDGTTLGGAEDLKRALVDRRDEFARCLTEKLLTYGLGREVEYYDRCAVDGIVESLSTKDYNFSRLVLGVVQSTPFRMKRGSGYEERRP